MAAFIRSDAIYTLITTKKFQAGLVYLIAQLLKFNFSKVIVCRYNRKNYLYQTMRLYSLRSEDCLRKSLYLVETHFWHST